MVAPDSANLVNRSENPKPPGKRPISITIIGWLFIVAGASAILRTISVIGRFHFIFDPAVLLVPIGIGLLRLRRSAHSCAMLVLIILWIVWLLIAIFGTFGPGDINFHGTPLVGAARMAVGIATLLIFGAVLGWMTRKLWKYNSLFIPRR